MTNAILCTLSVYKMDLEGTPPAPEPPLSLQFSANCNDGGGGWPTVNRPC
jgi:hypothetical protein